MGFFDAFQQWAGENRARRLKPILEMEAQVALKKQKELDAIREASERAALQQASQLIRQRDVAEDYQQEPLAEGMHGVRPEFTETDALNLFYSLGQAGIDPEKQAKSERERLTTEAFQRGIQGVKNEAALVNIGMGKEYAPVQLESGIFYNPYDTKNFNLGSTAQHKAETKLKQSEADEQTLRLARIRGLTDPIMQLNATSNKELGKPIEAVVEKDGKSIQTLISQDSKGNYHHSVVTDRNTGEPLVIPPEAVAGGNESPLIRDARVLYQNKVAPDMKTALEMSAYSKTKSPGERFNFLWQTHEKTDPGSGLKPDQWEVAKAVFNSWSRGSYGQPFPIDFVKVINSISDFPEGEKSKLLEQVASYNQEIATLNPEVAAMAGGQPGNISPVVTAPTQPDSTPPVVTAPTQPDSIPPVVTAPTQPTAPVPTQPLSTSLPAATTAPPLLQPDIQSQPFDLEKTMMLATQYGNPADIRKAMAKEGMALDDKSLGTYLISAINTGKADPDDMNFLAQLLGIDLKL